ncbi:MAG: ATP-binding protein [Bacteroidales bacterium]|nr:ATP-binding protein [Bacteroidales bacterium]
MVKETTIKTNADDLEMELRWFAEVLDARMQFLYGKESRIATIAEIQPPAFNPEYSLYASFISYYNLTFEERLLLVLALTPHLRPQLLDIFWAVNEKTGRGFTEIGGIKGRQHGGFLPTGETVMFLLGGNDLEKRSECFHLFSADHFFAKHQILTLEPALQGEPALSGALSVSRDFIDLITIGTTHKPNLSMDFPAKRITTHLTWNDLVLNDRTHEQLEEIKGWMIHGQTLLEEWGFARKFRKGYRCLFYGPPGTGKSLTASLLGKTSGKDVYRIDLSLVVSKYIGETEKNLSKIFNQAENKNWILFFDEADALFGKRTKVADAHDRYANQEVSYLLQRIEDHDGVVILASNQKENMDDAFTRRFESIIHFPMPDAKERLKIWTNGFSEKSQLAKDVNLEQIAERFEISGGAIMNIIRFASLSALRKGQNLITAQFITDGIRKELTKEGRTL